MTIRTIQKSIDFIEENLTEELTPVVIATVTGWSEWHFQRVFTATVGLSLKSYIRRRRLHEAGKRIASTQERLLDLALEFGFEGQEAFTRAFKKVFQITPGQVRSLKIKESQFHQKIKIDEDYLKHLHGGLTMKPKIIVTKELTIVGKSTHFISILSADANNEEKVGALWQDYIPQSEDSELDIFIPIL